MPEFDATEYFNRLAQKQAVEDTANPVGDRMAELARVADEKQRQLGARVAVLKQRELANKSSVVGQLGLDPEGIAGQAVNLGASAYSGASRLVGDVTGFVAGDLPAILRTAGMSNELIDAIGRVKQGKGSPEDIAMANQQDPSRPGAYTPLQMFDKAIEDRARSANIDSAFDRSHLVETTRRDSLNDDLGSDFQSSWDQLKAGASAVWDGDISGSKDLAVGVTKLIFNAGEASVSNPGAAAEYIAENAPQLAIGALGKLGKGAMLLSNVGYASENYQQGITKYQTENGGAMPPIEERRKMAAIAASLALAEHASDLGQLKAAKGAAKAVEETGKTGLVQSVKNTAKAAVEGGIEETLTEGYQTWGEGRVNGNPATALDIYQGAVIGGLSGAGLAGGARGVGEALKATPEHAAERELANTRNEALKAAILTGDVSALTDPKSPTYSPSAAVQALFGNTGDPKSTPEVKQANLEKANEIVADLEAQKAKAQEAYDTVSPEAVAGYKAQLAEAKKTGETEKVALLQEQLDSIDPKDEARLKSKVEKIDGELEQTRAVMTSFHQDSQTSSGVDVEAQVERVNTKIDKSNPAEVEARTKAADSIINLSMAAPERLDVETATALAGNVDNGLTQAQRTYFREFPTARAAILALQTTKGVTADVITGGKGFVGLTQYRERVTQALATGNKAQADQHLSDLNKFDADHKSKAAAVAEAWDQGPGNQVMRVKNGPWEVLQTRIPAAQVKANRGLTVNSPDLVTGIKAESDAISKTVSELNAAYAVKFSSKPATTQTTGASNVPNVSKPPAVSKATVDGKQAPQAAGSARSSEAAGRTARAGTGTPGSVAPESQLSSATPVEGVDSTAAPLASTTPSRSEGEQQSTKETVADAAVKTSSESAEQTTVEAESSSPKLTAMAEKSAEGTAYNLRNLIADYFSQSAAKEGDATQRPLAKVKDFLSQGWENVLEFIQSDALTEVQTEVLRVFKEKATSWAESMQKNLRRDKKEFWYQDLMQFLTNEADGKLDLDENVKTAMAYAAFSWVAENATRSAANTDEEINLILGREEDHPVEDHERRALMYVGTRQNVVANALGQRALQALGLKANKEAKGDLQPRLESALGAHVFKMMVDQGILARTEISPEAMKALTGKDDTDAGAKHQFLSLVRGEDGKLGDRADEIFKASMGTQGVLDKLFGVEAGLKEPSLAPVPFIQKTTRNTSQLVPTKLAAIIEHENAGASFVRQDMFALINHLDRDIALQIAGGQTVDPTETHKVNRPSNEAKNDGLGRELDRILGFLNTMGDLDAPMYFEHSVWKQQRVGIATNVVNPQTSKIHRHMLFRKSWDSKVVFSDAAQVENFQLRVAEGLGVKTDKQSNEKSIAAYVKKLADPKIQAAVAVLQKLDGGQLSKADQETLLAGVQAGGENMKSLDSLMALAHEADAKAAGAESFNVQLMGEVDGVTNGPMLSHLLMGAAASVDDLFGLLNRGGFFEVGNDQENYNLWREAAGHFDLYETTAGHMVTAVQGLINTGITNSKGKPVLSGPRVGQVMQAIYGFTGTLADKDGTVQKAGRNIIKTPLTAMVFGSSVGAAVESMANKFVESIYAGIEDTAKGAKGAQTREQLLENLALLGVNLSTKTTIAQLMEHEFKGDQLDALKKVFKQTVGAAVRSTMETDFASFIEKRRQFNLAAQTSHALYDAVYQGLRDELISELVASGDIAVNATTGKPLHDMTAAQEGELRKRLAKMAPVMQTLMSKDSNQAKAGLAISKSGRKLSDRPTYEGEVKFGDPKMKSTKTRAYESVETAPGVAMAPMSVHSTDSAISHNAADKGEVLNVHDAHGAGLDTFEQTARNLNQATWDAMLRYSPASEMSEALNRVVVGLAGMIEQGNLPPAVMKNLIEAITKLASKQELEAATFLTVMVRDMKVTAFQADDMKLQALAKMQSIDQYALQGGNYSVTEKDRAEAEAMRAGLTNTLAPEVTAAIAVIEAALTEKSDVKEARPLEEDAPPAKPSVFGELGKSTIESDPGLVTFFEANPEAKASDVVRMLFSRLNGASGRNNEFSLALVRLLAKTVKPGMLVKYVTPATEESAVLAKPKQSARGWFVGTNSAEEVYVLSPDFKNSGLTVETLLHELTHSALSNIVNREQFLAKTPGYTSEALTLINELETLRSLAQAYAKQNGLTKFNAAFANVDELISWGMTNPEFQRTILSKVSMESRTKGTGLVNGMKAFIERITGLLFKGSAKTADEVSINGITVLISNVSGLFNQAGTNERLPGAATINLSMASNPLGSVQSFSTMDIHNALNAGNISSTFDAQLRNLLGGIVERLHGPFGALKAAMVDTQAVTAFDAWQKALATGVAPFASSAQASPLVTSQQEQHAMEQVEVTVRAALAAKEMTGKNVYRELRRLYDEVSRAVKPSDFNSQAEYDYVFGVTPDKDGTSDHLSRFAAFGLANEQVNKILQGVTTETLRKARDGRSFAEKLQIIFEQILEFFHGDLPFSYGGQLATTKLTQLVSKLVDIEAKKRTALVTPSPLAKFENVANKAGEAVRGQVLKAVNSSFVKNNSSPFVKAAGNIVRIQANHKVIQFLDVIGNLRDKHFDQQSGITAGLLNELKGPGQVFNALQLARTNQEGERKRIMTHSANYVIKAFENGENMAEDVKAAISSVLLRTGMHVLVGDNRMTMAELENTLGNRQATAATINALESQLNSFGQFKTYFIHQANALAAFKVTGRNHSQVLMMNAHNIARLYGTGYKGKFTEAQSRQAEEVIEQLVALYSIEYSDAAAVSKVKDLLRSENARTEGGNGVEFTLLLHKKLEEESRDRLFEGQEALMIHGYTPEIYNPHTEVKVANETEGAELELMGYTKGERVGRDPSDPTREIQHIYVLKDGGMMPYVTGSISYTGMRAKGTTQHNGYVNTNTPDGLANSQLQASITNAKMQATLPTGSRPDLSNSQRRTYMAPVMNAQGDIVNWRYFMQESTKNSILERDNRFEKVIGALAGSIYDKETSAEINVKVVQALKDVWDDQKGSNSTGFVKVSGTSTDPELREHWAMLPKATRDAARATFGFDGVMVRKDAVTTVFGYRKFSLADAFTKDPDARRLFEKVVVSVMEHLLTAQGMAKNLSHAEAIQYAKRAAIVVTRGERAWQELVREVKDILVVKSGVVMLGNIYSNLSLLVIQGVPIADVLKGHLVALRGARDYQANTERLGELQARLDTGTTNGQEPAIRREMALLKDSMARNPVAELIEAGLMPSIVEDINADDDLYSYKSALTRTAEEFSDKINPVIARVAKTVYMGKDTVVYQGLSRITQLSDFMARYALYTHLTTRAKDPLSKQDAVFQASESFVNYDIPMHKGLQYMDDAGLLMFTKYFLRIQRVIWRLSKDNPGRVMMGVALSHLMSLGPIVLDSTWITRVGNNPLNWGALQLPAVLPDLASVSSTMSLLK